MSIEIEVTNDELENLLHQNDRIFLKLPIVQNGNFAIEKVLAFLKDLETSLSDMDIIVYSKLQLVHSRVPESEKYAKSLLCETIIQRTHPDMLPYLEIIISLPKIPEPSEIVKSSAAKNEVDAVMM